jgi:hypothetical protein
MQPSAVTSGWRVIASKALKQEKNPVKVYLEMELKNDRDDAMMAWI